VNPEQNPKLNETKHQDGERKDGLTRRGAEQQHEPWRGRQPVGFQNTTDLVRAQACANRPQRYVQPHPGGGADDDEPLHVGRPGQPRKSAEPLTLGPRKGPASEEIDEGEEHGPDDHADDPAWVPEEDTQFPAYDGGERPAIA